MKYFQNNIEADTGRITNQLIAFISLLITFTISLYAFFQEYNDRLLSPNKTIIYEKKIIPRKAPTDIPLYEFEIARRGIYEVPYYKLKKVSLTDNNNKWTFLFIGSMDSRTDPINPNSYKSFQESEGRFLNKIYNWVDHSKTNVIFVSATPPETLNPLGFGHFEKGCGEKCFDKYLLGGVQNSVRGSFYYTTQKWLADITFGKQYQHTTITSLPIVIIIDDKNIIREVMPSSYTALFAHEFYERLAQLQSSKTSPVYSINYLSEKNKKTNKIPSYHEWVSNKIKGN